MLRRCYRLLIAWQPPFVNQIQTTLDKSQIRAPVELSHRQHLPLSLRAREELANKSDDLRYHIVTQQWFGQRVDNFLLQHYPQWNYETMKRLVQQGHIYRYRKNGKKRYTRLTDRLQFDELVVVPTRAFWANQIAPPSGVIDVSENLQQNGTKNIQQESRRVPFHLSAQLRQKAHEMVLFKNEYVIVINKPHGVPMMPTTNPLQMNIADMLPAWKYTNSQKPIVCHNLDAATSGIVVLARTRNAHRMLGRMFVKRVVPNSVYWGFCVGKPTVNYGRIRMHFQVQKTNKGGSIIIARASPTKQSKVGIAQFVVNASAANKLSFISFYPLTTRRHQERIMSAHALRCPIIGDGLYGGETAFPRSLFMLFDHSDKSLPLHLHHRKIQLPYKNRSGKFICVTAPVPQHMHKLFKRLGWPTEADDPLIPG